MNFGRIQICRKWVAWDVAVAVGAETLAGRHAVLVDHAQVAEAHVPRIGENGTIVTRLVSDLEQHACPIHKALAGSFEVTTDLVE